MPTIAAQRERADVPNGPVPIEYLLLQSATCTYNKLLTSTTAHDSSNIYESDQRLHIYAEVQYRMAKAECQESLQRPELHNIRVVKRFRIREHIGPFKITAI